jgi:hypothetical protein
MSLPHFYSPASQTTPIRQEPFENLREAFYKKNPQYRSINTWFINIYNGLGDALPILGFLPAFRAYYKCIHLIAVSRRTLKPLVAAYESYVDACIFLDKDFVTPPEYEQSFGPDKLIFSSKAYVAFGLWHPLAVANRVPVFDWYKLGLRIPMNSRFVAPDFGRISVGRDKVEKLGIEDPNSVVILCPFTSFGPRLEESYWIQIAQTVSSAGYRVFTNCDSAAIATGMRSAGQAVPGTEPLHCTLQELFSISHLGAISICGSGGLAFVCACTKSPLCVVYSSVTVDSADVNSTFPGAVWTAIDSYESISRNLPSAANVFEILADEVGIRSLSNWIKNLGNRESPHHNKCDM